MDIFHTTKHTCYTCDLGPEILVCDKSEFHGVEYENWNGFRTDTRVCPGINMIYIEGCVLVYVYGRSRGHPL